MQEENTMPWGCLTVPSTVPPSDCFSMPRLPVGLEESQDMGMHLVHTLNSQAA